MKKIILAATILLAATSQGFAMDSLKKYTWENRVLVLFGTADDDKLASQIALLKSQASELSERDMVVMQVSDDTVTSVHGDAAGIDAKALKAEAGASGNAFQAVLIGKDGGVKLRSSEVVSDVEMFDLIDRMPMRQAGRG